MIRTKHKAYEASLLIEILLSVSIIAVLLVVGSQAVYVSLKSTKSSGEQDAANALASEALEAVRAISEESWQNIYTLTKSSQNYYPVASTTSWVIATGTEGIALNNASYTRSVVFNNVSRDQTANSRLIETSYNAPNDDPSTQLVTVNITWAGGSYSASQYLFRWKNKVCQQTAWITSGSAGVKTCPDTTYSTSTNIATGTSLYIQ